MTNKTTRDKLKQKLTDKYRLVILNEDTFEERFSLKLSRLNVFVLGGIFSIALIVFTLIFIAYTPIREYIPGYSSTALKKKATNLSFETDSLKTKLAYLESFTKAIQPVLTGELKSYQIDSLKSNAKDIVVEAYKLNATKEDSLFRETIESKDRFPLINNSSEKAKIVFFAPVSGTISEQFNNTDKHYAVDIVAKSKTPVKAVAKGRVIFAEWTVDTGYVITIQHSDNFISIYKHNGSLLKEQGDFVKSGEVIATVGDTGKLTTGPHLHFELWNNGFPVNPINYIDFQ